MLKFLVFADTHYKKGQYRTQVEDLNKIMKRAHDEGAQFVVCCGDFSNDYIGSPEFLNAYLNNPYNLPVYGVYGNHEVEGGVPLSFVSAHLTNRPVHFGAPCYGEDATGYYYTDIKNYRLICLDTNYSYNNTRSVGLWQHSTNTAPPAGNHVKDSLSPAQLSWLYDLIKSAADENKKVITVSHAGFSKISYEWSPDAENVQNIFSKFPGTVILAMNGHYHTDHLQVIDNVCYFDVNTAINGCWAVQTKPHYKANDTFRFTDYDKNGNKLETYDFAYNDLEQGHNTWSFSSPLSALVTISDDLTISVDGAKTTWDCGIAPAKEEVKYDFFDSIRPQITSRTVKLK